MTPDARTDESRKRPLDRALFHLSDHFRRRVLLLLSDHGPARTEFHLDDVAGEDGMRPPVRTRLYHVHLPKLGDAGYVEWDRESGSVRRGPNFDEVEPLVDLLHRNREHLPGQWP
jgi:hypothetical protein